MAVAPSGITPIENLGLTTEIGIVHNSIANSLRIAIQCEISDTGVVRPEQIIAQRGAHLPICGKLLDVVSW